MAVVVCILYFTVLFWLLLYVFYILQYCFDHCCLYFIFYSTVVAVVVCIIPMENTVADHSDGNLLLLDFIQMVLYSKGSFKS